MKKDFQVSFEEERNNLYRNFKEEYSKFIQEKISGKLVGVDQFIPGSMGSHRFKIYKIVDVDISPSYSILLKDEDGGSYSLDFISSILDMNSYIEYFKKHMGDTVSFSNRVVVSYYERKNIFSKKKEHSFNKRKNFEIVLKDITYKKNKNISDLFSDLVSDSIILTDKDDNTYCLSDTDSVYSLKVVNRKISEVDPYGEEDWDE